jgi:hypothetical protein
MFPHTPKSKLAQRALGAVRVARSFLLLEDDYEVDWEVGQDEPSHALHPHRAPLRRGCVERRPGASTHTCHVCLSPVERRGTLHTRVHARQAQAAGGTAYARDG